MIKFNVVFANKITLYHCAFFLFFLIIDLCILIPAVTAQIFNPSGECAIPTTLTNEVNAGIETQPLTAETKIRKGSK